MECLTMDLALKGNRLSQWKNYTFNSMVKFNGTFLGANNHGLFELTGDLDNASLILSEFAPIATDLGIINTKRMYYVYIGMKSDEDLKLTVKADDKTEVEYVIRAKKTGRQTTRTRIGRDTFGRYWTFTISNPSGNAFSIYALDVLPIVRNNFHV